MVMTPACDLVRRGGKPKTDSIILAQVVPEETVYGALKADAGRKKNLKRNNDKSCFHWLPNSEAADGGYLDFRRLHTVPLDRFGCEFERLDARIAPGFVKDIVSRFSAFYARQGQPVIHARPLRRCEVVGVASHARIEPRAKPLIVEIVRQRPGQPRRRRPLENVRDRARAHAHGGRGLRPRQAELVTVLKNLLDVHRANPLHRALPPRIDPVIDQAGSGENRHLG